MQKSYTPNMRMKRSLAYEQIYNTTTFNPRMAPGKLVMRGD